MTRDDDAWARLREAALEHNIKLLTEIRDRDRVIEVVAMAIRRAMEQRVKRPKLRPWDLLPEDVRAGFRIEAEAAIMAYESILKLTSAIHSASSESAAVHNRAQ